MFYAAMPPAPQYTDHRPFNGYSFIHLYATNSALGSCAACALNSHDSSFTR